MPFGDDADFGVDGFDQAVAELVFYCCFSLGWPLSWKMTRMLS
jgi:hypothetical protein